MWPRRKIPELPDGPGIVPEDKRLLEAVLARHLEHHKETPGVEMLEDSRRILWSGMALRPHTEVLHQAALSPSFPTFLKKLDTWSTRYHKTYPTHSKAVLEMLSENASLQPLPSEALAAGLLWLKDLAPYPTPTWTAEAVAGDSSQRQLFFVQHYGDEESLRGRLPLLYAHGLQEGKYSRALFDSFQGYYQASSPETFNSFLTILLPGWTTLFKDRQEKTCLPVMAEYLLSLGLKTVGLEPLLALGACAQEKPLVTIDGWLEYLRNFDTYADTPPAWWIPLVNASAHSPE